MYDLMYANLQSPDFNPGKHFAFVRRLGHQVVLAVVNFEDRDTEVSVNIPAHLFEFYELPEVDNIKAQGLLSNSPYKISFNSKQPTRVLVPANSGRLLKFEL